MCTEGRHVTKLLLVFFFFFNKRSMTETNCFSVTWSGNPKEKFLKIPFTIAKRIKHLEIHLTAEV